MSQQRSRAGWVLVLGPLLLAVACDEGKGLGESCPTNCAVGPDVRCLEQDRENGCASELCVSFGTEYSEMCRPCYPSGRVLGRSLPRGRDDPHPFAGDRPLHALLRVGR